MSVQKKGRFTVSVTSSPSLELKPSVSPSPPSAASPSTGTTRAVKRGRFLVSCLPCSSPCLGATLSLEQEEVGLFFSSLQGSPRSADPACESRNTCSSDDTHVSAMDHASACGAEITSPCRDRCPAAAGQQPAPAQSLGPRRVRFSDTADVTALPGAPASAQPPLQHTQPQQQQQECASSAHAVAMPPPKRHQQQPEVQRQLKHTRSYCSGRFTIQEAVSVLGGLHRSVSAPECARSNSSSTNSLHGLQDTSMCGSMHGNAASFGSSHSSAASSNGSECSFLHPSPTGCAGLLAANQLMSGLAQLQQQARQPQLQMQQHQQLQAAQTPLLFQPAGVCAAAPAGQQLYPAAPVPVPAYVCSEDDSSICSALLMSSGDYAMSDAAPFIVGTPTNSSYSSSTMGRRGSFNSSSSNSLMGGSCCVNADALAAAAAVGHHSSHAVPKRSPSVSYFRRGRFLVQTTMV